MRGQGEGKERRIMDVKGREGPDSLLMDRFSSRVLHRTC